MTLELNRIYCGDCLELMKEIPDKSIDLVLTDPPYGIGADVENIGMSAGIRNDGTQRKDPSWACRKPKNYDAHNWDNKLNKKYFDEIFRTSIDQIIFGGNYYTDILPPSGGWVVWDKKVVMHTLSKCEMAWASPLNHIEIFRYLWAGYRKEAPEERSHPTQKPVKLMEWCLLKYSQPGDTILDPFLGSGTTAVACKRTGRNFIGIEKEPKYVETALKRLEKVNNRKLSEFLPIDVVPA